MSISSAEAALQKYSHETCPRKIPPSPQEDTHAEVRYQKIRRAAYSSRSPTWAFPHKQIPLPLRPLPPTPREKTLQ